MPQDLPAEEAILGGMIVAQSARTAAADTGLTADDFYSPRHAVIHEAIRDMEAANEQIDEKVLVNWLQQHTVTIKGTAVTLLDRAGGPSLVLSLAERVPSVANARAYAAAVVDAARRRSLYDAGIELTRLAMASGKTAAEIEAQAAPLLSTAAEGERRAGGPRSLDDLMMDAYDEAAERIESGRDHAGLRTGMRALDQTLGGLIPELYFIAARPGMGKTAFAMQLAQGVAATEGAGVFVVSAEMSGKQLAARSLAGMSGVDSQRIASGKLGDRDWSAMVEAQTAWKAKAPGRVWIDDTSSPSVGLIGARARRLARKLEAKGKHLGAIVVDYLQLCEAEGRHENRNVEVSKVSGALKALSKDLNIPVVALSQLSREVERRADKRPVLSDLRDSGSLEQDAGVVMMLYREGYYDPDCIDPTLAEILIPKNRHGRQNTAVRMRWNAVLTRFDEMVDPALVAPRVVT